MKSESTNSMAAPSSGRRAIGAKMRANFRAYWRDPGLFVRLASTVGRTLFGAFVAYSAVVGLLPTAVNWAEDTGPSAVSQLASQGTEIWTAVFLILHQLHIVGLAFAAVVCLLILVAEILLPRRQQFAAVAHPMQHVRGSNSGGHFQSTTRV